MTTMENHQIFQSACRELKHKLRLLDQKDPAFTSVIRNAVENNNKNQKDMQLAGKFVNIANALTKAKSNGEVNMLLSSF